jgi:hypothetical protein
MGDGLPHRVERRLHDDRAQVALFGRRQQTRRRAQRVADEHQSLRGEPQAAQVGDGGAHVAALVVAERRALPFAAAVAAEVDEQHGMAALAERTADLDVALEVVAEAVDDHHSGARGRHRSASQPTAEAQVPALHLDLLEALWRPARFLHGHVGHHVAECCRQRDEDHCRIEDHAQKEAAPAGLPETWHRGP